MSEQISTFERVNNWINNSVALKLISITILMLLLLIPASMVKSIIEEREQLSKTAIHEVSSIWASEQQINGPVLTIPLVYEHWVENTLEQYTEYLHILPENLSINGEVKPSTLHRGIYDIVVYSTELAAKGSFIPTIDIETTNLKQIEYDKAFITMGISDLRGIKDNIQFSLNNQMLQVEPGSKIGAIISSGVTLSSIDSSDFQLDEIPFSFQLNLQGSQNLSFVPIGNTTEIALNSTWPSPSFNGNFLPDNREVSSEGFEADWKILQLNRNIPQSWTGSLPKGTLSNASFGVDLIVPIDDYQKAIRSAKYAAMTIALSFLIFFLVEIINRKRIHPFQYTLVGLALCLFYALLISISEHSSFGTAYFIATCVIVLMITIYSLTVFKSIRMTLLLAIIMSGLYGFIYVTLQLTDYALLMGSLGLTGILGLTMYFTRNINWYAIREKEVPQQVNA